MPAVRLLISSFAKTALIVPHIRSGPATSQPRNTGVKDRSFSTRVTSAMKAAVTSVSAAEITNIATPLLRHSSQSCARAAEANRARAAGTAPARSSRAVSKRRLPRPSPRRSSVTPLTATANAATR